MNNELVSIVIPIFNIAPYIDRCIESVIGQKYDNIEVVLVDDGSNDESAFLCDEWCKRDKRISVIHKTNGGLVSARKAGLKRSHGEYLMYVDGDDFIDENMISEMIGSAGNCHPDIITSGCIRDYAGHTVNEFERIPPGAYSGDILKTQLKTQMIDTSLFFRSCISMHIWNKVFRREYLYDYQMAVDDKVIIHEDAAVIYPCIIHAKQIYVTGKNYYHYCMRNDSMMGKKQDGDLEITLNYLGKCFSEVSEDIENSMFQFTFFKYYTLLLRKTKEMVKWKGEKLFPYNKKIKGKKIILYGSGRLGCRLKVILEETKECEVVGWIDKADNPYTSKPEELLYMKYDYILIGVALGEVALSISKELISLGIDKEKICMIDGELIYKEYCQNRI